jgi:excisionase family DNA binding protein
MENEPQKPSENDRAHPDQNGATYTPDEAGRVMGVSAERVRQLVDSGDLNGEKRKGRRYIFRVSVHQALEERGSPRITQRSRQRLQKTLRGPANG